jgi:hypothetical protein
MQFLNGARFQPGPGGPITQRIWASANATLFSTAQNVAGCLRATPESALPTHRMGYLLFYHVKSCLFHVLHLNLLNYCGLVFPQTDFDQYGNTTLRAQH